MKILHIIVSLNVGGAENVLKRLIEYDPDHIPNTVIVSLSTLGAIGINLRGQGVLVHALKMLPSGLNILPVLWRLVNLIRELQPDIIQTWMYHADLIGGIAAYLTGHKNVIWGIRRTSVSFNDTKKTIYILKICALLSHWLPKKIICVANAAKEAHINLGYDATKMVVIPNGFNFNQYKFDNEQRVKLRNAFLTKDNDLIIGCVGRFHPDKGQDNFVKAAALVTRNYPTVKFLLVGRDCDINNINLTHLISTYNLNHRFILLGERNDISRCLSAMDIYCMPSRTEGFPNSLGEAMSISLPCVATNVGDTAILTGNTAILVTPNDVSSLAQGLLDVLSLTKKQRLQMGKDAKEKIINEFSMDKMHARFFSVYDQLSAIKE